MQETQGMPAWSLGREDPLEGAMTTRTPVFLPGESHEQRSLVGYSPWGHKESDMTEWLSMHTCILKTAIIKRMHSSYIYFYNQKNAFKFHIPEKTCVAPIKPKKRKKKANCMVTISETWFHDLKDWWRNNKDLLSSTGNYIQHPVINHNGKEYMCITESLCYIVEINTTLYNQLYLNKTSFK